MKIFSVILAALFFSLSAEANEAKVSSAKEHVKKQTKSGKGQLEIFAKGKNAFFAKLSLAPGAKVPLHKDATEEYLYILSGKGRISINGKWSEINAGSSVYMPAGAEVTFENGDLELIAIQVFAGPGPSKKYDKWVLKK